VARVDFSPDGSRLASTSGYYHGQTLRVWELASGRLERTLRYPNATVILSPDWKVAAHIDASEQPTIELLRFPSDEVLMSVKDPGKGVLAFNPAGDTLGCGGKDGRIRVWRVSDANLLRTYDAHKRRVTRIAFSPDGKLLASGGADAIVRVCSVSAGELLQAFHEQTGRVMSLAFSGDGEMLASGDEGGTVNLWRTWDWKSLHKAWYGNPILDVAFSPDGKLLAIRSTSDSVPTASLRLWRVSDAKQLQTLVHELTTATGIDFSPDGKLLAAGCTDGTIRLFSPGDE
jgi:WD40 repeat protein